MRTTSGLLLFLISTNLWSQEYAGDPIPKAPVPRAASTVADMNGDEASIANDKPTDSETPSKIGTAPIPEEDAREYTGKCKPLWTKAKDLQLNRKAVTLLTHFTRRLDTRFQTRPAMKKLTEWSKDSDVPVVYLQEKSGNPQLYFYDDCEPTAYVSSDVGHVEFETAQLEHIVLAGGLFELCFNNTFKDVVRNWRDVREEKTLRITLVLDAIYGVASDSYVQDEFDNDLRSWIKRQTTQTLLMSAVLDRLPDRDHAWTFLSRKWGVIPKDFGLHVSFRDELTAIRFAREGKPTIWLEYTTMQEGFWPSRPNRDLAAKQ